VAALALAGCSSGKKSSSSATTTSTTAGASGGGGIQSGQLSTIASSVEAGKQATYKAVYTYSGAGSNGPITIEQKPPKTLFKTSAGDLIDTGTTTYYCATTGTPTCLSVGTGTANPLAGLSDAFNPDTAVAAIQAAEAEGAAHVSGYNVSFSTQSFGGASADCVTVSSGSQTGKYCVTKAGVLAYEGTATASFQLTSYSTNVADSDFSLPAGATITTYP